MKLVYIYGLYDPRDGALRYIGKTENLVRRKWDHNSRVNPSRVVGHHVRAWINCVLDAGYKPTFKILEVVPFHRWELAEQFWIAVYLSQGMNLCNIMKGGEKSPRITGGLSLETRAKISAACRGKGKGKKFSPEHRAKMSANRKAWWAARSEEQRRSVLASRNFDRSGKPGHPNQKAAARAFNVKRWHGVEVQCP